MANLYKQFKKYNKNKSTDVKEIGGILGYPTSKKTVEVPNRYGYVYVRLRNTNEIVEAYNGQVSPVYNLPVLIAWDNGGYAVTRRDTQRYANWGSASSYLPDHGYQHAFTGGDTTWISGQQFLPLLVAPLETESNTVYIFPYLNHKADGTWNVVGGTGTADLLSYCPTGSYMAVALLIYSDADGVPGVLVGEYFDAAYTSAAEIAPYIPVFTDTTQYPLGVVRLTNTTTQIDWSDIYDVRQFFKEGGGTAAGSDYIQARDEKPSGTCAGSSAADTWTIREINTEVSDAGGHCSVASNQITLNAGTYETKITAPFFQVGRVAIRLRNTTDNETTLLGSGGTNDTHCHLVGKFTIAAQKVFEVQYICEASYDNVGLGLPVAEFLTNYEESIEIYTVAEFWKVS